jgi:FAD/FMN-containing dehydrogenase
MGEAGGDCVAGTPRFRDEEYMHTQERTSTPLRDLRRAIRGTVITAGGAGYDEARAVHITGYDRRPLAVVRPADAADVARVIDLVREHDLELSIRSGGHSVVAHGTTDGGIMLDMSSLDALDIDVAGRTAWAGGGVTAGAYTRAAGAHGLATPFGDSPTVGIGGLTLGGGIGLLHRRHGMTIDNLLAADVVTADGNVLRADEHQHADLFWAIRGGGGNFGVVTRFRFRLVEVSDVVGGMLILPATPQSVAAFMDAAASAPEALSGVIGVMVAPPMPFLPDAAHGRPIIMAIMTYDGPADEAERAFAPLRAAARPLADMIRPLKYPGMFEGPEGPHPAAMAIRPFFMDGFGSADAETVLTALETATAPMSVVQLRVLGGAVSRVPADATAYAHRDRAILGVTAAICMSREQAGEHRAWTVETAGRLQQGEPASYVNFLGDEPDQVRTAYPGATWDRLRAVKAEYDPTNVFRLNQNVPPAPR